MNSIPYPEGFFTTWTEDERNAYLPRAAKDHDAQKAASAPAPAYVPAYTKGLKVLDAEELLNAVFPPKTLMLAPWLPDKGLVLIPEEAAPQFRDDAAPL